MLVLTIYGFCNIRTHTHTHTQTVECEALVQSVLLPGSLDGTIGKSNQNWIISCTLGGSELWHGTTAHYSCGNSDWNDWLGTFRKRCGRWMSLIHFSFIRISVFRRQFFSFSKIICFLCCYKDRCLLLQLVGNTNKKSWAKSSKIRKAFKNTWKQKNNSEKLCIRYSVEKTVVICNLITFFNCNTQITLFILHGFVKALLQNRKMSKMNGIAPSFHIFCNNFNLFLFFPKGQLFNCDFSSNGFKNTFIMINRGIDESFQYFLRISRRFVGNQGNLSLLVLESGTKNKTKH